MNNRLPEKIDKKAGIDIGIKQFACFVIGHSTRTYYNAFFKQGSVQYCGFIKINLIEILSERRTQLSN